MATEKRKVYRVSDIDGNVSQVLFETSAEQVTVADADNKLGGATNVEDALQKLATTVSGAGKVDDVRNNPGNPSSSIVTNKIADMSKAVVKEAGRVSFSYSVEGKDTVGGTAIRDFDGSKSIRTTFGDESFVATELSENGIAVNLKDSGVTAGTYQGLTVDAKGRVTNAQDMEYATKQELQETVAGKAPTLVYDTYQDFVTAVDAMSKDKIVVSTDVLIRALNVPDMWCIRVNAVSTQYVYTSDQDIIDRLNTTYGLTVGYFTFSQLETTKVDLAPYQTKRDDALLTNDKTIVGAVNEVKGVADGAAEKAASNAKIIKDIQDGKVAVGEVKKVENKLTFSGQTSDGTEATVDFDGSAAREIAFDENDFDTTAGANAYSVALANVAAEGTYSAVHVNSKGIVQAGGRSMAFIGADDAVPSDVMVGGLIFRAVE